MPLHQFPVHFECNFCHHVVVSGDGGTSGIKGPLHSTHLHLLTPDKAARDKRGLRQQEQKQKKLDQYGKVLPAAEVVLTPSRFEALIAYDVVTGRKSFRSVEAHGQRLLHHYAMPNYKLISRKQVKKLILAYHEGLRS